MIAGWRDRLLTYALLVFFGPEVAGDALDWGVFRQFMGLGVMRKIDIESFGYLSESLKDAGCFLFR